MSTPSLRPGPSRTAGRTGGSVSEVLPCLSSRDAAANRADSALPGLAGRGRAPTWCGMDASPDLPRQGRVPVFNLPGIVTASIAVLAAIHIVRSVLPDELDLSVLLDLAFIPARWTAAFDPSRAADIVRAAGEAVSDPQIAAARREFARYLVSDPSAMPSDPRQLRPAARLVDAPDLQLGLARGLRRAGGPPLRGFALRPHRARRGRGRRRPPSPVRSPTARCRWSAPRPASRP